MAKCLYRRCIYLVIERMQTYKSNSYSMNSKVNAQMGVSWTSVVI